MRVHPVCNRTNERIGLNYRVHYNLFCIHKSKECAIWVGCDLANNVDSRDRDPGGPLYAEVATDDEKMRGVVSVALRMDETAMTDTARTAFQKPIARVAKCEDEE